MSDYSSDLVLWLFVLNLGIAFGAGLYEARIVLPQWLSRDNEGERHWDAWAARRANVGLRFWAGVTTVPLTLLTVASFVAAWATPADVRGWWLFAAAAATVERAIGFSYSIPTMRVLMSPAAEIDTEVVGKAQQWVRRRYVRHAATLVAWLAALKALSLMGS